MPPTTPNRPRAVLTAGAAALLLLTGCADAQEELERAGRAAQDGVAQLDDEVRGTVEDLRRRVADADVDPAVRDQVQEAVTTAEDAAERARSALEDAAGQAPSRDEAVQQAEGALADARAELDAARQRLEESAGGADEALSGAVEELSAQVEELSRRLAEETSAG